MLLLRSTLLMLAVLTLAACVHRPLDHFKCYVVEGEVPELEVLRLEDQFHVEKDVQLVKLRYFCNPVTKFIGDEPNAAAPDEDHLTCYMIKPQEPFQAVVTASNQFGETEFKTLNSELLCVPTRKHGFVREPAHCPGGENCCCNMPDGAGGTWPDCGPGFPECQRSTGDPPSDRIQVCRPAGARQPVQLHPSQPPFCRR